MPPKNDSSETSHTPGPWFLHETGRTAAFGTVAVCYKPEGAEPVTLCEMPGHWPAKDKPEQRANARLIASAPEMLEALRSIIEGGNVDRGAHWLVDIADITKARAAIARATTREG